LLTEELRRTGRDWVTAVEWRRTKGPGQTGYPGIRQHPPIPLWPASPSLAARPCGSIPAPAPVAELGLCCAGSRLLAGDRVTLTTRSQSRMRSRCLRRHHSGVSPQARVVVDDRARRRPRSPSPADVDRRRRADFAPASARGRNARNGGVDAGRYVERSTRTVGDYLDEWLEGLPPPAAPDRPEQLPTSGRSRQEQDRRRAPPVPEPV
jgi:hypothetical protein